MADKKLFARLLTLNPTVYPLLAPLGYAKPCVIFNRIGTTPWQNLGGDEEGAELHYQIDVYDTDFGVAKTLAQTIRTSLKAWTDTDIMGVTWEGEADMLDATTATNLYRVKLDFTVYARV